MDVKQYVETIGKMRSRDFWFVKENGRTFHRVFFINPSKDATVDDLAASLINIKQVDEISVHEIDAGFVARVRLSNGRKQRTVLDVVDRRVPERFGKMVCYDTIRELI